MADPSDLYPTAAALGKTARFKAAAKPERLDCLRIRLRDGAEFYYEYRFVSSVKRSPKQENIVMTCTCNHVATIEIKGRNLQAMAFALAHMTLAEIQEADSTVYAEPNEPVVTEVIVTKPVGR
jgi:hypothetical protein